MPSTAPMWRRCSPARCTGWAWWSWATAKKQLRGFRLSPLGAFVFRHTDTYTLPPAPPSGPRPGLSGRRQPEPARRRRRLRPAHPAQPAGRACKAARAASCATPSPRRAPRAPLKPAGMWTDILATLRQAAGGPPPRALAESLRRWRENFGSVQIYSRVALLELADDYALAELLASTSLCAAFALSLQPAPRRPAPRGAGGLQGRAGEEGLHPQSDPSTEGAPCLTTCSGPARFV